MDANKDYYAILGVLPDADSVVIRAVYRALAQRYHPDKYSGPIDEATKKMAAINEAYEVLSDVAKRKEYDSLRGSRAYDGDSYFCDESDTPPPSDAPSEREWKIAAKYYPDLPDIEARLNKIAWRLAFTFRAFLLQEKEFERRKEIAEVLERHFLELYFGTNPVVLAFAKKLVFAGEKAAARELNETIRVLGNKADPNRIVEQIKREYSLSSLLFDDRFVEMARNLQRDGADPAGIRICLRGQGLADSMIEEIIREVYR